MFADDYIPSNYFSARDAFRSRAAQTEQNSYNIAARGPNGETLSIDSAYLGNPRPRQLLVMTSGIHGVEGYAGSALQQLWLGEFSNGISRDTGVLLVHALNPYGFAHNRRVNEHNVDLNRNALATFPGPPNPGYRSLNTWLNPPTPAPRLDDFMWRALPLLIRHGRATLSQAIATGQYEFPQGLFYGGREREASLVIFANLLADARFANVQRVIHLDLHTGLGRYGRYQLLLEELPSTPEFDFFTRIFGAQVVKSDHASNATHYSAHGILSTLTHQFFPNASTLTATLEIGTLRPATILRILRAENRVHHHGARCSDDALRIRTTLYDALAPRNLAWRTAIITSGRELFARLQKTLTERSG